MKKINVLRRVTKPKYYFQIVHFLEFYHLEEESTGSFYTPICYIDEPLVSQIKISSTFTWLLCEFLNHVRNTHNGYKTRYTI